MFPWYHVTNTMKCVFSPHCYIMEKCKSYTILKQVVGMISHRTLCFSCRLINIPLLQPGGKNGFMLSLLLLLLIWASDILIQTENRAENISTIHQLVRRNTNPISHEQPWAQKDANVMQIKGVAWYTRERFKICIVNYYYYYYYTLHHVTKLINFFGWINSFFCI